MPTDQSIGVPVALELAPHLAQCAGLVAGRAGNLIRHWLDADIVPQHAVGQRRPYADRLDRIGDGIGEEAGRGIDEAGKAVACKFGRGEQGARFPQIVGPKAEDICYATSNRQAAVKAIAPQCQLVLVIGAPNSSNSLRLVEVAQRCGARGMLIQRGAEIDGAWLDGVEVLGLTAGASAPEELVNEVIARIGDWRDVTVEQVVTAEEKMVFKLPRQLVD